MLPDNTPDGPFLGTLASRRGLVLQMKTPEGMNLSPGSHDAFPGNLFLEFCTPLRVLLSCVFQQRLTHR